MRLVDHLAQDPEPTPEWIRRGDHGRDIDPQAFFASRVVYHPGYSAGGIQVSLYNRSRAAHHHVFADERVTRPDLMRYFAVKRLGFPGYQAETFTMTRWESIRPTGRTPWGPTPPGFCLFVSFQRLPGVPESEGPESFLALFVGADGLTAFPELFAERPPHAVVLHDRASAPPHRRFGGGSALQEVARTQGLLPAELIVGGPSVPWSGYVRVPTDDRLPGSARGSRGTLYRPPLA